MKSSPEQEKEEAAATVLNAKERRKNARKERMQELEKRKELIASLEKEGTKVDPPEKRKSIFGNVFGETEELDWAWIDGLGWYNKRHEGDSYLRHVCKCYLTKKNFWKRDAKYIWDAGSESMYPVMASAMPTNYVECGFSGGFAPKESMIVVYTDRHKKHSKFCIPNYRTTDVRKCDFTGDYYSSDFILRVRGSSKYGCVCIAAVDGKSFSRCHVCGNVMEGTIPVRSDSGHEECNSCYEQRIYANIIHPHNFNGYPDPIKKFSQVLRMEGGVEIPDPQGGKFFSPEGRKMVKKKIAELRMFGAEVETEINKKSAEKAKMNRFSIAKSIVDTVGSDFVIVKEDGTLTANGHYSERSGFSGFEVVTAPASLDEHRKRWTRLKEASGYEHLRAWDAYDTCGFHVHVSRASLTHMQIGRILMFINHKNNAKFVHRVAGRGSDRFCKYIPKEPDDKTHPVVDVLYPGKRVISRDEENGRNRSRRVAVNLSNPNTIEFRIFRGTVNPKHILRNMEFCDAVCDFCYPANFSIRDLDNYKVFIAFVNANKKRWPLLAEWLANQDLIKIRPPHPEKAEMDKRTIKPESVEEPVISEKKEIPEDIPVVKKQAPVQPTTSPAEPEPPTWATKAMKISSFKINSSVLFSSTSTTSSEVTF